MTLIFCIEKSKGMLLFKKRHATDNVLRQWIIEKTAGSNLWMSNYSAGQFKEKAIIKVDDEYDAKATDGDYCFVEDKGYDLEKTNEIILCNWNRKYPSDKFFDIDLKANGFKKVENFDIKGSSHEKITIETYRR